MASEDSKSKKRKSAPEHAPKPKKQKKTDDVATAPKKSTKPSELAPNSVSSESSRKHAEDFFDDENAVNTHPVKEAKAKKAKKDNDANLETAPATEAPQGKSKRGKKGKKSNELETPVAETELTVVESVAADSNGKKSKKTKKSKRQEGAMPDETTETVVEVQGAEEEDLDDQTAALLAGFESDRDESDLEKEDEDFDEEALPQLSKKKRKELEKARKDAEPGVIYLGRIPHGFFEPQMKKYFSQFGTINRLRLSRNKKTGASKHFAFIEFANADVANIVAKTMDTYLMFGHILQCRTVAPDQVHPELFKGANERFKVDPRNRKAGAAMARGAERAVWEKRVGKENKKRAGKTKALRDEFGYEFAATPVKAVDNVPKKIVEDGPTQQLLTEAPVAEITDIVRVTESEPNGISITETIKVKKPKKGAKGQTEAEPKVDGIVEVATIQTEKQGKKDRKRKSNAVAEVSDAVTVPSAPATKSKKAKKESTTIDDDEVVPEKRKAKATDQTDTKPKRAKKVKA